MKYRPICNCPNKRKWVVWGQAILLYCLSSATVFGEETRRVPAATTNSIGMKMVLLPAGEFVMGSPETEEGHAEDERQHQIRITKPFHIGQHEVTVGQFRRFVSDTNYKTAIERDGLPGFGFDTTTKTMESLTKFHWQQTGFEQTDEHPVVNINWDDANAFCRWLSGKEREEYRLPTEAQWEYACRAGTSSRYAFGENEESLKGSANVADASFLTKYADATWSVDWDDKFPFTAPVGSFKPNSFELYDMHGNVWEWCSDWYGRDYFQVSTVEDPTGPDSGERRVLRGGAFTNRNKFVRSADRDSFRPKYRYNFTGFRIVRPAR